MKTRSYIIALLAGAGSLALVACSPKKDEATPTTSAGERLERTAATVGDSIQHSWDQIKDATYDERATFQASLDNLTTTVDQKINELQARSASATDATKDKVDAGLEKLQEARAELQEEINELGDATAATWNDAKAEVASAWQRVREAYTQLES